METVARENIIEWEKVARLDYTDDISNAEKELALKIANCLEEVGINAFSSLIELGSGSGHLSAILSERGYQVTLMDFSKEVLDKSERLFKKKGLKAEFICGDIFNVNQHVKKEYDVTWNSGVMEHFTTEKLLELFKTIKDITKHYYVCVVPNPESLPYLLFRYKAMKAGNWLYGMEFLRDDYEEIAEAVGFKLRKKIYLGNSFTTDYIRYFFGNESGKEYQEFLEAGFLPEKESYLMLYLFEKEEGIKGKHPLVYSSCEVKTINFDYITALQKKNRDLLQENFLIKFEFERENRNYKTRIKEIISSSGLPVIIHMLKKYGVVYLLKSVAKECRNSGVINSIKYYKNKVITPVNSKIISTDSSINLLDSSIDFIKHLEQQNLIKGIVFIDSAFDFDESRNQRSICVANELNLRGYFVFFLRYQWGVNDTSSSDFKIFKQGIMQIPRLKIEYLLSLDIIRTIKLNSYFIITIPDMFLINNYLNIRNQGIKVCYDILDNWKEFNKVGAAPWYNENIENFFINNADVVTAVSKKLVNTLNSSREIKLLSNGLSGNDNFLPYIKEEDKYHVGYIGHLTDKWFHWDYIFNLAKDNRFVIHIIGEGASLNILKKIKEYKNIIFYGYIPKTHLKQYASYFNVGLIPFINSELSNCVDPLKVYDYLQFGRPVVSTGIPHISEYPYCINTVEFSDFKDAIIKLSEEIILIDKNKIISFLRKNTWNKKITELLNFIQSESITGDIN